MNVIQLIQWIPLIQLVLIDYNWFQSEQKRKKDHTNELTSIDSTDATASIEFDRLKLIKIGNRRQKTIGAKMAPCWVN